MSTSFNEIKEAIDLTATAFTEYKKVNDARIEAEKNGRSALATELNAKLERIETDIKAGSEKKAAAERELEFLRERVEELEAKRQLPGATAREKLENEYKDAFIGWVRGRGQAPQHEQKMSELQRKAMSEFKDVTIGSNAGGGFAVPEEISRDIEKLERKFSPVRSLVKVVRAGTSDYKELVAIGGATGGWIGESGTRSATATSSLREVAPTHGELYAYPQASEWSLDDIFFNVENWLAEETAEVFAIAEANAVLTGDASSKPTGMLNSAPTNVADWAGSPRAAAVYQFIANVDADLDINSDKLIDLVQTLNSRYRAGSTWAMNSLTQGVIRKLKNGTTGDYFWQPGLQAGTPDSLLGYPVSVWEQMADIANGAHPIAFGNFRRGYVLADRVGMRMTRDNVTNVGFVRFYMRRREGGIVLNNDAIKWLKTTTT